MITKAQLKAVMPYATAANLEAYIGPLNDTLLRFEINTPNRIACFLAQIAHECACLGRVVENMNYSAERLAQVWPRRFAVDGKPNDIALRLANKPEQIANHVYANRMGNGDTASGDGWRYRGRGCKHLTGKNNYAAAGAYLRIDLLKQPELVEGPVYATLTAGWFWEANNLNRFADTMDSTGLTKAINGGLNGYEDRVKYLTLAKKEFGIV